MFRLRGGHTDIFIMTDTITPLMDPQRQLVV